MIAERRLEQYLVRGSRGRMSSLFGLALLLLVPGAATPGAPERAPVLTTPHFALFSDFDMNLNDALIAAGLARKKGKAELFKAGDGGACFAQLDPSTRAAWNAAVGYYTEVISPTEWNGREQYLIRVHLAGFEEELKDERDRQFVEIAQGIRAAAAPAYRACRWNAQDEKNRRWIAELGPQLAAHERKIATRLEELYQKRWGGLPIPVDVVEVVNWSGANSILRGDGGGHLLVSSANPERASLEVVFHEASHILMGRGDPVRRALEGAAAAAKYPLPGDLWHVVLFYTTGEVVRGVLEDGEGPKYTPMVYEIFDRGDWTGYRKALESAWRPYVEGRKTLSEAAAGLIRELRTP